LAFKAVSIRFCHPPIRWEKETVHLVLWFLGNAAEQTFLISYRGKNEPAKL
jgi:hypothetical protein